jgi:hypothetical protein
VKLSKFREAYYYYSGTASNNARQLAFAGIAVIWIFKTGDDSKPTLPSELIFPLGLLVLTLASDLFQYLSGTVVWGATARLKEKSYSGTEGDPDLPASRYMNYPTNFFFYCKLSFVILAYYYLLKFFLETWFAR